MLQIAVDSIANDGRAEDSRRRMRSQLNQLHGNTGSLSPQRATGNYHSINIGGSNVVGPTQAETNETLRKTKDLQDIISRIRNRSDLMA
jgi:hypothetical protein